MPLTNCKLELKLKWTNYYLLSAAGADNVNGNVDDNVNGNNIIFTIYYFYYFYFQFIKIKRFKRFKNAKRFKTQKYYLPKGIIKNYNDIIYRKDFYNQGINSDLKRYEKNRKLITGQSEDYTIGYLLDYDYVKNHYRSIVVDLGRQKESESDPKAIQQIELVG